MAAPRLLFILVSLSALLAELFHFVQTPIRVPGQSEAGAAALEPERARSQRNTGAAGAALNRGRERDLALPQPRSAPVIRLLATLRVWDLPVLNVTSSLLLQVLSQRSHEMLCLTKHPYLTKKSFYQAALALARRVCISAMHGVQR